MYTYLLGVRCQDLVKDGLLRTGSLRPSDSSAGADVKVKQNEDHGELVLQAGAVRLGAGHRANMVVPSGTSPGQSSSRELHH